MRAAAICSLLLLTACAPYSALAPTRHRDMSACDWVRDRIADGSLPSDYGPRFYPDCAPFPAAGSLP
jgi:hypothetical protein